MATLTVYSFSKRHRSTKQPSSAGTVKTITLKDGTDLISPVFLLNNSGVPSFNYCEFQGRYYFVNDIKSVRQDLWEVSCTEDYLATHKTLIGTTIANILYATGGRNDIIDRRIPVESDILINSNSVAISGLSINQIAAGTVIISVTGIGSFGNYALGTQSDLYHMIENVGAWWSTLGITDVQSALQQFFYGGNVADCLKNAIALPFDLPYTDYSANIGPAEQLYLGSYPCTNQGNPILVHRVNNPIVKTYTTIAIPWQVTDWRKHSPYSMVQLYLPLIGTMNLNADELINATSLDITYSVNITSGDLAVEVSTDSPVNIIATASNNVAMALPYGSANISPTKAISAGLTAIAGAATGIAGAAGAASKAAAAGALASGIGGGLAAGAAQLIGSGVQSGGGGLSGGASQGLFKDIKCTVITQQLTDSQTNLDPIIGKPVMQKSTIGSYTGYVQTDGCQVDGAILDSERDEINTLCDGGIYYE